MTEAHTKELISKAYVNALAARVGMTVANSSLDYGLDGTFKDIEYDVETKEYYSKERIKREITAGNCTGAAEQIGADVEAMLRDLQEILRIGAEQRRLWEVYEGK